MSTGDPSLEETITWMQNALAQHNGQHVDSTIAREVKILARLTAENCKLTYELSKADTVQYDLADIDPKTIKTEKIGELPWVTFKTRDFHKSVHYTSPGEPKIDYMSETGGFSLDSPEVAASFSKALTRAVNLCGGKPSTY